MNPVESGQIKFFQNCPPPLVDGEYLLTVNQVVKTPEPSSLPQRTQNFVIRGERFTLNPADLYSVYPPANTQGAFANDLPHIVFNRRSLPWERKLNLPGYDPGPGVILPWVALLTFDSSDHIIVRNLTVKKLIEEPQPTEPVRPMPPPSVEPDPDAGESMDDPCVAVEIPIDVFQKIIPSLDDLGYLAHARAVDISNKATGESAGDGWFSAVISNRFPLSSSQGVVNTVHLVSLEGYEEYLMGKPPDTSQYTHLRMVSLASWSFTAVDNQYDFAALLKNLDVNRLSVQLGGSTGNQMVDEAINRGYVPFNHTTRAGYQTVSWYRGPLVPLIIDQEPGHVYLSSDEALRYDPRIGMFDVSYAAAWQLGKLLALQNQSFAVSMFQWRLNNMRRAAHLLEINVLQDKLQNVLQFPDDPRALLAQNLLFDLILKYWQTKLGDLLVPGSATESPLFGNPADPSALEDMLHELPGLLSQHDLDIIAHEGGDLIGAIHQKLFENP